MPPVATTEGKTHHDERGTKMTTFNTGLGKDVDQSIDNLLVTTETLGYQKGKYDTIKRICTVLDNTAEAFEVEGDKDSADTIRVAIKVISAIYVS
jgi:hypothetical protein